MRVFLTFLAIFVPNTVFAHLGHVGDLAGHDHWLGAAALGIALGAAILGALSGKSEKDESEEEAEGESDELVEA